MSNPVPPPGGYQPPADQGQPGFPPAQHGQPAQGYPPAGQPTQGYPPAGQPAQGFPPAGQPVQGFPPGGQPGVAPQGFGEFPTEKKKGGFGKLLLRIVSALVVIVIIFVVKSVVFGDKAKDAKAGDCIASDKDVSKDKTTKTGANVVDCTSTDAKFSVVARVDGETDVNSKSCEKFFKEDEEYYVYASDSGNGKGYLLCLKPKA